MRSLLGQFRSVLAADAALPETGPLLTVVTHLWTIRGGNKYPLKFFSKNVLPYM